MEHILPVRKTTKLFIGGQFVRSESGRSHITNLDFIEPTHEASHQSSSHNTMAMRVCAASVKDLRQAVEAAHKAQPVWASKTPYLRAQILYRMGEMLEGKKHELQQALQYGIAADATPQADAQPAVMQQGAAQRNIVQQNISTDAAESLAQELINISIYYAGFADKYQHLASSVNPVQGAFHNFTVAEPVGVVALLGGENFAPALLFDALCAALCSGNAVVGLMNYTEAALLPVWSEVCATCDIPPGVVNLLSGEALKLYEAVGRHMQIQAVQYVATESGGAPLPRASLSGVSSSAPLLGDSSGSSPGLSSCESSGSSLSVQNMHNRLHTLAACDMKRVKVHSGRTKALKNILQFVEYKTVWHPVG